LAEALIQNERRIAIDVKNLPIWSAYILAPAFLLLCSGKVILRSESPIFLATIMAGMVGVLGYDALFPLVFGGGWNFAGGVGACIELHFMFAIAGVCVVFSLQMRHWRQRSAREDQ
jgi:hypothetical protein